MTQWLVKRINVGDIPPIWNNDITEWLAGFGFEAKDCAQGIVITQDKTGEYFLHVSRFVRNENDRPVLDQVTGIPQSTPSVVSLGMGMPDHPWMTAVWKREQTIASATVTLRSNPATVTVLDAPPIVRIDLRLIQRSDPSLLGIEGDRLHMGKLEDGREVVYRIDSFNRLDGTLELRRVEPELSEADNDGDCPTCAPAARVAALATGGLVRQSDQLTMVSETGPEATS